MAATVDAGAPAAPSGARRALARVNGVDLGPRELELFSTRAVHPGSAPAPSAATLDALVREELHAQRALALGLERDPSVAERLERLDAEWRERRRQVLAERFLEHLLASPIGVSEDEVRAFLERNAARTRRELSVRQLLYKGDEPAARAAVAAVHAGASFEDVARRRFGALPAQAKPPWELGWLRWDQVPEPWWGALEQLAPGAVSDVIAGKDGRCWVLQLVAVRDLDAAGLEALKPRIVTVLRRQKLEARRQQVEAELLDAAEVVYVTTPRAPGSDAGQERPPQ